MIEQDLITALTSASAIQAICGTRIYPLVLPKDPTLPAIDYKIVGGSNTGALTTRGVQRYRVEINCWGDTYLDAINLRFAVIAALDGTKVGSTAITYLMPQDFFEDELLQYRACAEFYALGNT
jgi:Protein of unknown function (DUF3168)